ncbi:MAG: phosphatidylserine decarboxylase family protein [Paludibacter sp.]|nr:phosphatidylserine decarboxylase family protein [Bacteroidales bacterium]MCM1069368.1 phosphatidylserine decarboxylase family protein [Prevotella sp.]MCM1353888.1 phosphatidylserine decarboxylase family protein [Bacteroides sp.]MCM1442862.1 phosphatidylserine decarboxylase family protein [Muribaculum sp.]MCM1481907.1 phosphatidylserine decarboxylase family protein [Paludibacter sp.]
MKRMRIHREGRNIICALVLLIFIINVPIFIYQPHWVFALTLILTAALLVFVTYFFRNPVRILEVNDPQLIIAPADGHIVVIEETEETEHLHERRLQVSIFMSPFNVHANWYPVEGKITHVEHHNGRHKAAWLPKSSTENERSTIIIETPTHATIMVRQIAGALARRIVTYAKTGKTSHRNEHLGFIKFGSRVDMYLPLGTEMYVDFGELVKGNETIIARLPENNA